MSRTIARITNSIVLLAALTPVAAAGQDAAGGQTAPAQTAERSRTQGMKETEQFVKAGGMTSSKVAEAENQIKSTLAAYNTLVTEPSKDMKADYKKLMKSGDGMNAKLAEARQKVEEMQKAGDVYFNGRTANNKNIQDSDLQSRANQRLEESRKSFAGVLDKLRAAGNALEPFRKQLADQITYLGSDLTPSAMTSLKPNADKLNSQGGEVFSKVDEAIAEANKYFQGLRPTES